MHGASFFLGAARLGAEHREQSRASIDFPIRSLRIRLDELSAIGNFSAGNGVCLPANRENRLTGSELMTPVERSDARQEFYYAQFLWVSRRGAIDFAPLPTRPRRSRSVLISMTNK
jgi:hypothetical protein